MNVLRAWPATPLLLLALTAQVRAGGSGFNLVVVVNQNSSNSVQLGNYYAEKRHVPPQNLLRINWPGQNVEWSNSDFNTFLLGPLLGMVKDRQLTHQVDYVLLSMDIPYRVTQGGDPSTAGINSTTAAIYYGFKPDLSSDTYPSCSLPSISSNSYAGSEAVFHAAPPATAATNAFMTMMLTASNLPAATLIVDRGAASDGAFPTQTVWLAKSDDRLRNLRFYLYDQAIFDSSVRGNLSMARTNTNSPDGLGYLLGYQNGMQTFGLGSATFVPGAMADNVTSYGGMIFENSGHTPLLVFLGGGAAGSYGTVVEPCAYFEKFPSPQNYFYQARGFSLAECYYQSLTNPYQGLLVGEPLAAPFAQPASGAWNNLPAGALLAGATNLSLQFTANSPQRPIQQVDLFVDGLYFQTLTNIAPGAGNVLSLTINGVPTNYTVPPAATLQSIAADLTAFLNTPAYANATRVAAFAHGDRVELRSVDLARAGSQVPVSASASVGGGSGLTAFISASRPTFLDSTAWGLRSYVITNVPQVGDFLQATVLQTNGQAVITAVTNTAPGTNLATFARRLFDAVNTNPLLQGADGLVVEDVNMHEDFPYNVYVYGTNDHSGEFNVRARSTGWPASQTRICFSGSATFTLTPPGTNRLDQQLADLQPRNHLYVTAGATNLPLAFVLNTAALPDGFHELAAVAYEGSHVRTQTRLARNVRVRNGPLAATFTTLVGASNTLVDLTLQFSVVASTNNLSKIELFSTGGSLGSVSGQSNATFAVPGTNLDLGLHPFYAVVTAATGKQYRTETQWIRLVSGPPAATETPFPLAIAAPPPALSWPATAGRRYEILSTTNLGAVFQLRASLVPSNSPAHWSETSSAPGKAFYRVRAVTNP